MTAPVRRGAVTLEEGNTSRRRRNLHVLTVVEAKETLMRIDDTTSPKLAAIIAQTLIPLVEQFRALNEGLNHSMQEFWASPNGRLLRTWIEYHDKYPSELNAMIRARGAEAALVSCDCLCRRWGHLGACSGWATTQRDAGPPHHVVLQVCGPCAAGIDGHRMAPAARSSPTT